jgi:hypothetical protein
VIRRAGTVHLEFGRLPSEGVLRSQIAMRLEEDTSNEIPESGAAELYAFLSRAYAAPATPDQEDYGRILLRLFLEEREVAMPLVQHMNLLRGALPANLPALLADYQGRLERVAVAPPDARVYTPAEFAAAEFPLDWLVEGLLVRGQPCIAAGPSKAMKTSLITDLAVSIGLGTGRLLGHFTLTAPPRRVGFVSGESGAATLKDLFERVCAQKGRDLADANVYPCFRVPKVTTELPVLTAMIRRHGWEVLFLDPLYLSLLAGHKDPDAAIKLHVVGPLLADLCGACLRLGCTPILVHHTTKHLAGRKGAECFEPLELTDVHGAGTAEFARQWLLVNRREAYDEAAEAERLWLRAGGSAGHSGLWGVDVAQGRFDPATCRRQHWRVSVLSADRARGQAAERGLAARAAADGPRQEELERQLLDVLDRGPRTRTGLAIAAGVSRDNRVFAAAFERLLRRNAIRETNMPRNGHPTYESAARPPLPPGVQ